MEGGVAIHSTGIIYLHGKSKPNIAEGLEL